MTSDVALAQFDRALLIEFNELCPTLLETWIESGDLPNFKAFFDRSDVFVSMSDEPDSPNLEPWIQWYSVHTGLSFSQHGVFRLTDGPRQDFEDIWSILLRDGRRVGNFSSMNAKSFSGAGSFYLPDPWCTAELAHPGALETFYRFVATQVQGHYGGERSNVVRDYADLLYFLATHGFRPQTAWSIVRQLLDERSASVDRKWSRVTIMDELLMDVFAHYWRKTKPCFATFFSNSTAHLQHAYWRYMAPEQFNLPPSARDIQNYGGAILHGYKSLDRVLGRIMRMVPEDTLLIFATALSQQPYTDYDGEGGRYYYRLKDPSGFLQSVGIAPDELEPVMTHQFYARFRDPVNLERALTKLQAVRLGDTSVFDVIRSGDTGVFFGCNLKKPNLESATVDLGDGSPEVRFGELFFQLDAIKSGKHHPQGALWFRTGRHTRHDQTVSILDVFPTLLEFYGCQLPNDPPRTGRSLLDELRLGQRPNTLAAAE
jgi:hypothetical protein